jgi:hypothetical protein
VRAGGARLQSIQPADFAPHLTQCGTATVGDTLFVTR